MRVSVLAMRNLPSYDSRCDELLELENRLETLATPHLIEALSTSVLSVLSPTGDAESKHEKQGSCDCMVRCDRLCAV